jgi:hypothetical protein
MTFVTESIAAAVALGQTGFRQADGVHPAVKGGELPLLVAHFRIAPIDQEFHMGRPHIVSRGYAALLAGNSFQFRPPV